MMRGSTELSKYINIVYIAYRSPIMSGEGGRKVCGPILAFFVFFGNFPNFIMIFSIKM